MKLFALAVLQKIRFGPIPLIAINLYKTMGTKIQEGSSHVTKNWRAKPLNGHRHSDFSNFADPGCLC